MKKRLQKLKKLHPSKSSNVDSPVYMGDIDATSLAKPRLHKAQSSL